MPELTIKVTVEDQALWEGVWGCIGSYSWWHEFIWHPNTDWDKIGVVTVVACDPDDEEKEITKHIGIEDIRQAWEDVLNGKGSTHGHWYHCGGTIDLASIEDGDDCTGDAVLQMAMYGTMVFS